MQIARYLPPLLLLPVGAAAWGQTDTDASTAGAYGLAGLGLGVGLKLVSIIGDLVKDKIAQRSGASPAPTTAASMSVGTLLDDRLRVLDAVNSVQATLGRRSKTGGLEVLEREARDDERRVELIDALTATLKGLSELTQALRADLAARTKGGGHASG